MSKKIIISIIFASTLLSVGTFFVFKNKTKPLPITINQQPIIEEKIEEVVVATTTNMVTSAFKIIGRDKNGWNIVDSEKYKMRFSYPASFFAEEFVDKNEKHSKYMITNANFDQKPYLENGDLLINFNFIDIIDNMTLSDWFKKNITKEQEEKKTYSEKLGETIINASNRNVSNTDAKVLVVESKRPIEGSPGISKTVFFKKESVVYSVSAEIPLKNKSMTNIFDKILNSLELID